jgi:F-type H+-transporting ATPase subunit delta
MSVYRISYRYANSLMLVAEEKKAFKRIAEDADLIFNTLAASKELRLVLKSPVIKSNVKKDLLEKIFIKKISPETSSFMNFVLEKNREDILYDIFKEFTTLVDQKNGVVKANVVSASELNEDLKDKVNKSFEKRLNKKVTANYSINPDLIGGFIVKVEDTVYDSSIKHQLALLSKKLSEEVTLSIN